MTWNGLGVPHRARSPFHRERLQILDATGSHPASCCGPVQCLVLFFFFWINLYSGVQVIDKDRS
jgi:hypothetical protein